MEGGRLKLIEGSVLHVHSSEHLHTELNCRQEHPLMLSEKAYNVAATVTILPHAP